MYCEELTEGVDGLGAIVWHQITKETGGDYWVSSTQKYQGSVAKSIQKLISKLQISQHLDATEDKIRDDHMNDEKQGPLFQINYENLWEIVIVVYTQMHNF